MSANSSSPQRRRPWKWLLLLVPLLLAAGFAAYVIIGTARNPLMPEADAALQSSATVTVTEGDWIEFKPQTGETAVALIIYPGGLVPPAAYAPLAHNIAAAGYLALIVPMPLNLAVTDVNAADKVIAAYPDIQQWAIGGHSLGGAMAASYTAQHPQQIAGLVLWASYPPDDLSSYSGQVVSIYGSNDGLAQPADIEASRAMLPPNTVFVALEGGNHTQFGWYGRGLQSGDNPATLSRAAQQQQILENTVNLLATLAAKETR
ncbi:MAG: alpha/beta fold hydrolase [Anaerolineales bacterium]|nr:alpha/beta fold hydrolase [Anaerolineales bacterium]MCB8968305.1 alpha/beta fold hydrolase [Ardenticatenaceae bacterium]